MSNLQQFSHRERQIMDALYRLGEASVKDVRENIDDAPSYSSVRTFLQKLVEKGHIAHREDGKRYLYYPIVNHKIASNSALTRIVSTFFKNSTFLAMNFLLDMPNNNLSDDELAELRRQIQKKRKANKS